MALSLAQRYEYSNPLVHLGPPVASLDLAGSGLEYLPSNLNSGYNGHPPIPLHNVPSRAINQNIDLSTSTILVQMTRTITLPHSYQTSLPIALQPSPESVQYAASCFLCVHSCPQDSQCPHPPGADRPGNPPSFAPSRPDLQPTPAGPSHPGRTASVVMKCPDRPVSTPVYGPQPACPPGCGSHGPEPGQHPPGPPPALAPGPDVRGPEYGRHPPGLPPTLPPGPDYRGPEPGRHPPGPPPTLPPGPDYRGPEPGWRPPGPPPPFAPGPDYRGPEPGRRPPGPPPPFAPGPDYRGPEPGRRPPGPPPPLPPGPDYQGPEPGRRPPGPPPPLAPGRSPPGLPPTFAPGPDFEEPEPGPDGPELPPNYVPHIDIRGGPGRQPVLPPNSAPGPDIGGSDSERERPGPPRVVSGPVGREPSLKPMPFEGSGMMNGPAPFLMFVVSAVIGLLAIYDHRDLF